MLVLVNNLQKAYAKEIDNLEWIVGYDQKRKVVCHY
jgi:predicted metalloendopeptidase